MFRFNRDLILCLLYTSNPTGVVYSPEEVAAIGRLAKQYDVAGLADERDSRQIFDPEQPYAHLRALEEKPDQLITIIGPSKTAVSYTHLRRPRRRTPMCSIWQWSGYRMP